MKKFWVIIALVVFNLVLVFLAFILHYGVTGDMIKSTDASHNAAMPFFAILYIIGFVIFFSSHKFRRVGIGVIAFGSSTIVFLFFFLNKSLASQGNYQSFRLREV